MEQDVVKPCTNNPKKIDYKERYDKFLSTLHDHKHDEKVYCYILEQSASDKENNIIHISLSNDLFLEQDRGYFFGEKYEYEYVKGYHPYFYEFIAQLNDIDMVSLSENISPNSWITAKLIVDEKYDKNKRVYVLDSRLFLHGCLIFAASPIERKGACLVFNLQEMGTVAEKVKNFTRDLNNKLSEWLAKDDTCTIDTGTIKGEFETFVSKIESVNCNIYNVGQGNNISLDINNKRMFFDVGEDRTGIKGISAIISEQWEKENKREIKDIVPDFIVLSHWDLDHILGGANFEWKDYGDKGEYYSVYTSSYWIAPDFRLVHNKSISALRLCCYLLKNKRLWMVNALGKCVVDKADCKLWQGGGGKPRNNNDIGLVLELSVSVSENNDNRRQKMLLMGDCAFEEINALKRDENKDQYKCDILVTAHHGSKYALPYGVSGKPNARAIISVGIGNSYNHPNLEHLTMLQRNGFKIYLTCETRKIAVSMANHQTAHLKRVK